MNTVRIHVVRRQPGPIVTDPDADGLDDFGDPIRADASSPVTPTGPQLSPLRIPIDGCVISGSGTSETERDRDTTVTDRVVHVPPGADVRATDEVDLTPWLPGRWHVVGAPARRLPHAFTGAQFLTRVVVRRTEG